MAAYYPFYVDRTMLPKRKPKQFHPSCEARSAGESTANDFSSFQEPGVRPIAMITGRGAWITGTGSCYNWGDGGVQLFAGSLRARFGGRPIVPNDAESRARQSGCAGAGGLDAEAHLLGQIDLSRPVEF